MSGKQKSPAFHRLQHLGIWKVFAVLVERLSKLVESLVHESDQVLTLHHIVVPCHYKRFFCGPAELVKEISVNDVYSVLLLDRKLDVEKGQRDDATPLALFLIMLALSTFDLLLAAFHHQIAILTCNWQTPAAFVLV